MFKKKEPQPEKPKAPEYVECAECKHLVRPENAQFIKSNFEDKIYCPEHRKNYTRIVYLTSSFSSDYYPTYDFEHPNFLREIEVDKNGEPIGYKKIKSK